MHVLEQIVAVKTIKEDSMETEEFMKEAHVMKKLQCVPFLCVCVCVCTRATSCYFEVALLLGPSHLPCLALILTH